MKPTLNIMQHQVLMFQEKMGQPTRMDRDPGLPDLTLRRKLIREEHTELQDAIDEGDFLAILDGGLDLLYVLLGMFNRMGVDASRLFTEVHRSNMTKKPGNVRGDGKIIKDEDFEPPVLVDVLATLYGPDVIERLIK